MEPIGDGLKEGPHLVDVLDWGRERGAHTELRGDRVAVLAVVNDVALRLEEGGGEGMDDSGAVRALNADHVLGHSPILPG